MQLFLLQSECFDHLLLFDGLSLLKLFQFEFSSSLLFSLLSRKSFCIHPERALGSDFLLLLRRLLDHLPEVLLFLLLLLDDLEVGVLVACFIWIDFLVVLKVDLVVVLVFAASPSNAFACVQFILLVKLCHKVSVLAVQCTLEFKFGSISLNVLVLAFVSIDTLSVTVVLKSIGVFCSEFLEAS